MFRSKISDVAWFVAVLMTTIPINAEELKCGNNLDCPKGTYCYKENAFYKCVPCSNCMRFFRRNATSNGCPQSPEQCGKCIPGYYSPKLIDGSEPSTCILINTEVLQPMKYTNQITLSSDIPARKGFSNPYLWVAFLGIASVLFLAVATFCAKRKSNRCNINKPSDINSESDQFCMSPSAPPPPYQNAPQLTSHSIEVETKPIKSSLPFASDIEINTTGSVRYQIDCEFDKRQQANCYKYPYYVNEGALVPDHGEQVASSQEEENLPEIFDDTTQPSAWRPVAEADETEQLEENENSQGTSGCNETRQFTMLSVEHPNLPFSPGSSSSSNISMNMGVQNFRPTHKKHRTSKNSAINSFNLNICINNTNANLNENNNNL